MSSLCFPLLLCCGLAAADPAPKPEAFTLRDGDRVVLVGSTLIEREQRYGYWEAALTRRYPDRSITFRNLGWSGDTVFGDARAGFGTQADGFRQLKDHVLALKPTVLIIGYGTNESFDGPKGLPRFVKGLETLLVTFAPTGARIILLSPLKQENLGPPLPDPKGNNKNLRLYSDAIRDVAKKRGHRFVDLFDLREALKMDPAAERLEPLTDNGIHLTAWGYWLSAAALERGLGLPEASCSLEIQEGGEFKARGARLEKDEGAPLRFRVTDAMLPMPPAPEEGKPGLIPFSSMTEERLLFFQRARPREERRGKPFTLTIDGQKIGSVTTEAGYRRNGGPEFDQAERLRRAIVAKNRLYFYRWRPENETYLFGFRKHEQGQNAREIPQFDPLIEEKEKEIAKLRVPVPHAYELKAEKKP